MVKFDIWDLSQFGVVNVVVSGPITLEVARYLTGEAFWAFDEAGSYVMRLDGAGDVLAQLPPSALPASDRKPAVAYVVNEGNQYKLWRLQALLQAKAGYAAATFLGSQSALAYCWAEIRAEGDFYRRLDGPSKALGRGVP